MVIAGVRGRIERIEAAALVVDLHGFMLRVHTSARVLASISAPGESIELATHLVVREDGMTLYGFLDPAELELFQLLLTVSGVGPKVALSLLSFADAATVYSAIANEDVGLLSKAPGIGRKTAEQIVFHLRRKLPDVAPATLPGGPLDTADRDAIAALEALGYTTSEARGALAAVEAREGMSVEERVFHALQRLARA